MSYRNPQTVIDTESAKYYAQAISSIGQSTVKALNTRFARAQAIKKSNLKSQADLIKFSSDYLKDVNKSLKDFNITPQFRKILNDEINKAAELRQQLANINLTGNDRLSKQNELNALETFFDVGLPNALENLKGERDEISAKQVNLGQEGGLSASATNPQVLNDINDTFSGNPKANYDFNIIRDDSGALNVTMTFKNKESIRTQDGRYFGEKQQTAIEKYSGPSSVSEAGLSGTMIDGRAVSVGKLKASKTEPRTYNLNSDFTPQSLVINPVINKGVSENLENEKITLNGAIDLNSEIVKGMLDGTRTIKTVDKNNVVKEYEVDNLNIDKFKNTMLPGLKAQITGVIKQGRASSGDMGSGLVGMQSWIDDVLGEDIDLEPSSETDHGLTPESFAKLTDAILDKKHRELQDAMPRLREVGVEETDDRTAEEKNEARRKANLSKEIDLLGKKLEEKVIPTFTSLDDPNVNKLITYIENLDGIKSVDFSKDLAKGDKSSFKVVGNLGKSVTIDNGMSQAQIKKAILKAAGANDKQVNVFDFTKTDDKMIVGSDIIDVPNEFDIFKRQ
jgi:copper chaperone CopZ